MRPENVCLVFALSLSMLLGVASVGRAQAGGGVSMVPTGGQVTTGALQFREHCAPCHGPAGKGDGPVAKVLTSKPADLTMLAKNNNGEFPQKKVEAFIDGSEMVAAHGTREMPIWGTAFRRSHTASGVPQLTPQEINERIKLLVDYIKSIQEK
jgi:mono/diheme cytochrome c family protein